MSQLDGQRSMNPPYTGYQAPGAVQADAVLADSSCHPSTCTLQVAPAVAALSTPHDIRLASAGAVAVTVTWVQDAVADPVRVTAADRVVVCAPAALMNAIQALTCRDVAAVTLRTIFCTVYVRPGCTAGCGV